MTALDLLFDCIITDDMEAAANENYDCYSIMPDGRFILMKDKDFMKDWLRFNIIGVEDFGCEDNFYIEYSKLEFLRDIMIEGSMPAGEPYQRNQLIAVLGTCDHKCPQCKEEYDGYCLRAIPNCNGNLVGTTVWTRKLATLSDFMEDVFMWMKQCKGLNVLIINFDYTPDEKHPDLNFEQAYCSILIQGNAMKFLSNKDHIQKLYKKYAAAYECYDYSIEDYISHPEDSFYFRLDKPKWHEK